MKDIDKTKVYVYCDPRYSGNYRYEFDGGILKLKFKPFYIGCAKGNNYLRHLYKGTNRNENVKRRIKKIREEGLEPVVKVLRSYSLRNKALKLEEKLIVLVGRQDLKTGPLLNKVDGGLGGKNPDENNRKKQRKVSMKNAKNQWKDPKFREMKIRKGKEQWESIEYRKEMSEKFRKAWNRPGYKKSRFSKTTLETELTEKEVLEIRKKYKNGNITQNKLAEKYKTSRSSIWRIINGYSWKYI